MAKGIRLNLLAKELGVQSKDILDKLRAEGLSDAVPNHQSSVGLGLAETIREWFGNGGGTAVEIAPPPLKKAKTGKKSATTDADDGADDTNGETHAPSAADETPAESHTPDSPPERPETVVEAPVHTTPAEPQPVAASLDSATEAAPAVETSAPPAVAKPSVPAAPTAPPAPRPAVTSPGPTARPSVGVPPAGQPMRPAATMQPPAAPGAPGAPRGAVAPTPMRPTIKLESRQGGPAQRITPAFTPAKATIQGPKVIREEKPDHLPAPRPRRPLGPTGPGGPGGPPGAGFSGIRATVGRGVRVGEDDEEEKKKAAAKSIKSLSARRRGADGRRGEADEKLREFSDQDLRDRSDRLANATGAVHDLKTHLRKSGQRPGQTARSIVQRGEAVPIEEPITVKTLAAALGVKVKDIMGKLMRKGVFATINHTIDSTTAQTLALDYNIELVVAAQQTLEQALEAELDLVEIKPDSLQPRPPVVTILGHVDHGKTSLLDRIRKANVAAGEAGGITQHTAAWKVQLGEGENAKRVTFIDTPGHEAFTAMRARGANMTDIVVLVVSAAEGVQPQTIESINHARAAEVPIVVAMNKIDRDDANPDMVLGQLAGQGLNPVEWGGDIEVVRTSATTGEGIENLIEILDLQASLMELKADPTVPARGMVIEARMDPGMGPVATVLVEAGTLKVGDVILSGSGYGRVRQLLDDSGRNVLEASPSTPVIVSGLGMIPGAGDKFFTAESIDRARAIAEERELQSRRMSLAQMNRVTGENLFDSMAAVDIKTINLIIKADVQGSLETLVATVGGQNTEEVKVKVIHSGVGGISESDVQLAMATKAKPVDNRVSIIGFHVVPDESARQLAEQNHVEIKLYRIIYEIFDDLKNALSGMLKPEVREKLHGNVEVRQVFKVSRLGNVAGCYVTDGHISRGSKIRLIRDGKVITEDITIDSLKRLKDDVKEVKAGLECGIKLVGYDDLKIGDRLQAYIRETFERTL